MRKLTCFLLLLCGAGALQAADTWRWVDANGVVHYSDVPVPGAERVDLGSRVVRPKNPDPPRPVASAAVARDTAAAFAPYTRCAVIAPANDEVFQGVQDIAVSVDVAPALRAGHRIEVQMNGSPVADWPAGAQSYTLPQVFRGSYSLTVRVLDAQGTQLCSGPPSSFHVRQASIYSPARQPPPRPPPRPAARP
ncbi:MAG: DUF4124 domain-containing protein [Steroidobacteraceae bacterium]